MLELLAPDAQLVFEHLAVGPFTGREAIGAAYGEQPPDDEIRIADQRMEDGELVAGYEWARQPRVRAGELRLRVDNSLITRLVVSFD